MRTSMIIFSLLFGFQSGAQMLPYATPTPVPSPYNFAAKAKNVSKALVKTNATSAMTPAECTNSVPLV